MEILGMGPAEMLVIMVIALIVFGPGRLPEIGAALGRAVGDFRRASRELTADLQGSMAEVRGDLEGAIGSTQADLQQVASSVQNEARALTTEVRNLPSTPASPPAAKKKEAPADDDPDAKWLQLGSATEE
jgi:TatA/E family protein of Tat protein translocase